MHAILRTFLLGGALLAAIPAWTGDPPSQPSSAGTESLPSLSSIPQGMAAPDRVMSVTCYLGNPADRQTLGSITVNVQAAGSSCNSIYYSCQGRCFGCYADFDLSEDICVDSSGRKYLR